jgi:hypothetical protein
LQRSKLSGILYLGLFGSPFVRAVRTLLPDRRHGVGKYSSTRYSNVVSCWEPEVESRDGKLIAKPLTRSRASSLIGVTGATPTKKSNMGEFDEEQRTTALPILAHPRTR